MTLRGDARRHHPGGLDMSAGQSDGGGTGRTATPCLTALRTPSAQTGAGAERFGLFRPAVVRAES